MKDRPAQTSIKESFFLSPILLLTLLLVRPPGELARAQEYMFTTLAGSGGPGAIDGAALNARFNHPQGVTTDNSGDVYVADSFNATVRKIAADGTVSTVAGLATIVGADDGRGANASFLSPTAAAMDAAGNLFIADYGNSTVRKITPDGAVTTFAGASGQTGAIDGVGTAATFSLPAALSLDSAGNLFVADQANHTIRKITPDGTVTTFAGKAGRSGADDGIADQARFTYPSGITTAPGDILYVADSGNHTIRKITPDANVTTFAGTAGFNGSDDGLGSNARFYTPFGVAADSSGNVYVADTSNNTIRKITPDGNVTTFAGDPTQPDLAARPFVSYSDGSGGAARFKYPYGVTVDKSGSIYVADTGNDAIRRISPAGLVSTLAGSSQPGSSDGPAGALARFAHPTGVAVSGAGDVFVVDGVNNTVREITRAGSVTTLAGSPGLTGSDDGLGSAARFNGPRKLALDSAGNIFVADTANSTIRKLTRTNSAGADLWTVSTFAGLAGNPGTDNGRGDAARFNALYDVAIDHAGNLYIADKDNDQIRKATPDGVVAAFAGIMGIAGWSDGPAGISQFNLPYGVAVDSAGTVYVADTLNHVIRKIARGGIVSTLAGQAGMAGSADGLGSAARFNAPYGVAVDGATNVYVADYLNGLIRKIIPSGLVSTIGGWNQLAPDGSLLMGSSDGAGSEAQFHNPKGIAVDNAGTIYIADSDNNAIRMGTTNFCVDQPTIDQFVARVGQQRQLDTTPQTAVAWQWSLIRRPANSHATLSASNVRNPTFTPDVEDLFIFQLRATNTLGASGVRTVALSVTPPPPMILPSSLTTTNGQFSFTFQGPPHLSVQVQVSLDLILWLPIGTFTNQDGTFTIVDQGPNPTHGFYRLFQR